MEIDVKIKIPNEKSQEETLENKNSSLLDMVIAFDTTGSMSFYIDDVKKHVRELIPELLKSNDDMRIGIIAFGDYCDMNSKDDFGKAYQKIDLTRNENDLIKFVSEAQNTSGGDGDEFYELVLKKVIEETEWRDEAKKSILLIADCDPHPLGYTYRDYVVGNQIDWKVEAKKAASKCIQIDTLSLHNNYNNREDWYKELSAMTNGVYAPFKTSEKTTEVIKTAAWSRGGLKTKDLFVSNLAMYNDVNNASYDAELGATYTAYACKNSI